MAALARRSNVNDFSTIKVQIGEGLGAVTLSRPDRMNGMSMLMVIETYEALSRLAADRSVRVVTLSGEGRGFCPGADLSGRPREGPEVDAARPEHFHVPVLLHEMPQVTIAAVNGACAGAGLGWAAACDLRYAARSANFNTAFLDVAVAGDMGVPWTLPRLVGAAKARELSFFPDKFSADEALRIGFVTAVFDDATFRQETAARVDRLLHAPPEALRTMKLHFLAAERTRFSDYIDLETSRHIPMSQAPAAQDAFRAFAEARRRDGPRGPS